MNIFYISLGPEIYAEPERLVRRDWGKTVNLKCWFGIRNFLWNRKNKHMVREGTWFHNGQRIQNNVRVTMVTNPKGKARYANSIFLQEYLEIL